MSASFGSEESVIFGLFKKKRRKKERKESSKAYRVFIFRVISGRDWSQGNELENRARECAILYAQRRRTLLSFHSDVRLWRSSVLACVLFVDSTHSLPLFIVNIILVAWWFAFPSIVGRSIVRSNDEIPYLFETLSFVYLRFLPFFFFFLFP